MTGEQPDGYQVLRTQPALAPLPLVTPTGVTIHFPENIGKETLRTDYLEGRNWKLVLDFDFASQTLERIVRVPAGFVTDFASIPRILWPLLPPTGTYGKAAVLHDYLYRTQGACNRSHADRALLEAMVALGVPLWICLVIYLGVRLGGHRSYKGGL